MNRRQGGGRQNVFASGDAARLRIRSQVNGRPVDEWIAVGINCTETNMGGGRTYRCGATVQRQWAPQGGLLEARRLYWEPMGTAMIPDQAWTRWTQERQARAARRDAETLRQMGDDLRRQCPATAGLAQINLTGAASRIVAEDKALQRRLNACDVVDFLLGNLVGPQPCPGTTNRPGPDGRLYPAWQ
jgi:hypothetical protein